MYRFLFFVLLLIPNCSFSQYREYQEGDLMHVNNLTFKVSYALDKIVYLTNVTNHLENQWVSWADGDPISEEKYDALRLGAIDENSVREAIRNTFTEAEYTLLAAGKDHIEAFLTLSSEGKILELSLFVNLSPRTLNLTPQQYADLETNLKKHVYTTVTPDMAKLSFWRSFLVLYFDSLGILYRKINPDLVLPDSVHINP